MIELVVDELIDQQGQPIFKKKNIEQLENEELIEYYKEYCEFIRKGINNDITKSLNEGKSVIIEGYGLDMGLILDNKNEHEFDDSFIHNLNEYVDKDDY